MDQNVLIEILKEEPMKLTLSEIEQMMDSEMEKDPSEMDSDLIDLCSNVLKEHIK